MSRKRIDRDLIDHLDRQGFTAREIAGRAGCDRSTVRKILTRELGRDMYLQKGLSRISDDAIREADRSGLRVDEVEEKYGLTRSSIQKRAVKVLGHPLPHAPSYHFEYSREEIKRFLDADYSPDDIVEIMGINREVLFRIMRNEFGIVTTKSRPITDAELREMERLLNDGWSYKQIGRKLGRADKTVAKHFPGRGWSVEEANEYRRMFRILDSL